MFHGETSIEINSNVDHVYKISKENTIKHISGFRPEVNILEQKNDFIKLKVTDIISGKKVSWILDTYFDDNNKIVKHIQSEGPLQGLVSIWYFIKIEENKTQLKCVHDFVLKNIPVLKNLFSKMIYKSQIEPASIKRLNLVKEEVEKNIQ